MLVGWTGVLSRRLLYPERRPLPPTAPSPAPVVHVLRAQGGVSFPVWQLIPVSGTPRASLLLCHGYSASRHQVLGIADRLRQRGYETLVFELRGHGDRPGPCTLGALEADDAVVVLRWAQSRAGRQALPMGLLGLSMGAAVVCQAAAREGSVRAVVTDSAYAHLFPVLRRALLQRYRLAGLVLAPLAWWIVQAVIGRRLAPRDPGVLAPGLRQPLLAIQSGEDQRVSPALGQEFYERWAGPKERWYEPAAAHVGLFARGPEEYCSRVADFLARTLG